MTTSGNGNSPAAQSPGPDDRLPKMDVLEKEDRRKLEALARRRLFQQATARAQARGFTARQAPFAAMAYLTISALGGSGSVSQVRARVQGQYPWLFEEAA